MATVSIDQLAVLLDPPTAKLHGISIRMGGYVRVKDLQDVKCLSLILVGIDAIIKLATLNRHLIQVATLDGYWCVRRTPSVVVPMVDKTPKAPPNTPIPTVALRYTLADIPPLNLAGISPTKPQPPKKEAPVAKKKLPSRSLFHR